MQTQKYTGHKSDKELTHQSKDIVGKPNSLSANGRVKVIVVPEYPTDMLSALVTSNAAIYALNEDPDLKGKITFFREGDSWMNENKAIQSDYIFDVIGREFFRPSTPTASMSGAYNESTGKMEKNPQIQETINTMGNLTRFEGVDHDIHMKSSYSSAELNEKDHGPLESWMPRLHTPDQIKRKNEIMSHNIASNIAKDGSKLVFVFANPDYELVVKGEKPLSKNIQEELKKQGIESDVEFFPVSRSITAPIKKRYNVKDYDSERPFTSRAQNPFKKDGLRRLHISAKTTEASKEIFMADNPNENGMIQGERAYNHLLGLFQSKDKSVNSSKVNERANSVNSKVLSGKQSTTSTVRAASTASSGIHEVAQNHQPAKSEVRTEDSKKEETHVNSVTKKELAYKPKINVKPKSSVAVNAKPMVIAEAKIVPTAVVGKKTNNHEIAKPKINKPQAKPTKSYEERERQKKIDAQLITPSITRF